MKIFQYLGSAVLAGLSLLPMACSSDDKEPLPPQQPNLEQRIILNEGEDVKLGDTVFIGSLYYPQETLKYAGRDEANKTLKFTKPGTSFTREITYDVSGFGALVVNGQTHGVHVNENGSLRIDLDASNTASNNSTHTFFRQNLIIGTNDKVVGGDYFFIKNADGDFMPYQYSGASWGGSQPREVIFGDLHNWVDRHYILQDDGTGNFKSEIDFNGTKIIVKGVSTSDEITLSSFDGKNLECLLSGAIVANEGRSIKPEEHFLVDTMDSPAPKGEVWKYLGKDPVAESSLKFRKYGASGFENQDITISNNEGMLMTGGFSYRVKFNPTDGSVNVDLDKSGSIGKNEIPLLDRYVFNEKRDIAGGDVFVLQNATETEQFHSAYSLQLIDTVNKRIMVTNRNQGTIGEYSFSDEGDGTIGSSGISHSFKVTSPTTIQIDMNGDGKIE